MESSYLLIDEFGRFLDASSGSKTPTESILTVGLDEAYNQLVSGPGGGFNYGEFIKRDGLYDGSSWSKSASPTTSSGSG